MNEAQATLVLAIATLVVAIATLVPSLAVEWLQRRKERKALRNALFAELRHIRQHYTYAGSELRLEHPSREARLTWSKFGEVDIVGELSKYAILGAEQMQLLLQISLRIRNTDDFLDMLLKKTSGITEEELTALEHRMSYLRSTADKLISYVVEKDRSFSRIPEPE